MNESWKAWARGRFVWSGCGSDRQCSGAETNLRLKHYYSLQLGSSVDASICKPLLCSFLCSQFFPVVLL